MRESTRRRQPVGGEEHRAWVFTGRTFDPANPSSHLGYSDGNQSSRPAEGTDDDRDADADGLNNYIETTAPARRPGGRRC